MHIKRQLLAVPAMAGALLLAGASVASAGEAQGNSSAGNINETGMRGHANSICGFSGQNPERFLDPADPNYEPGRVQNWGHVRQFLTGELGLSPAQIKASGEQPGDSCNGHSGFLAGGGEEP
jgi:hypothetical protein